MKVYLLSIGDYSYYHILGVYSEDQLVEANRVAELVGGTVEEPRELNAYRPNDPEPGKHYFHILMYRDGKCDSDDSGRRDPLPSLDECGDRHETHYHLTTREDYKWERRSYWHLDVYCYAEDFDHARKIANDLRARLIAKDIPKKGPLP